MGNCCAVQKKDDKVGQTIENKKPPLQQEKNDLPKPREDSLINLENQELPPI